jgi:hypothetical protein
MTAVLGCARPVSMREMQAYKVWLAASHNRSE